MFHQSNFSQSLCFNGKIGQAEVRQFCNQNHTCRNLMKSAMSNLQVGSCTNADLAEALQYRPRMLYS
jgi:hypothetical protein